MMYAEFEPLPEDVERRDNARREQGAEQQSEIAKYVQKQQLTELKNPFYNISSYFLDNKDSRLYEVINDGSIPPYFKYVTDPKTISSLAEINPILSMK